MPEHNTPAHADAVKSAFEAARTGDFGPSTELGRRGRAIVPLLRQYLDDPDEEVRGQAVALLGVVGGDEAASLLAVALGSSSADVRDRAALQLYNRFDPAALGKLPAVGKALRDSVTQGTSSAAAVLLLGYFPETDSALFLRRLVNDRPETRTKLHPWSHPVPVAVPVEVALSRLGEADARQALLRRIEAGNLDELVFLLEAIREVDAPTVLHALKAVLADEREISGGGLPSGAEPKRRLADLAVDALVGRLGLNVGFEVGGGRRYSEDEIGRVRAAVNATLPR